ncbi:MAG TPA: nucleotidyltransferase family protein [Thermoanaerobaculia bacterium]|nr:nucleotidyltransferase family protein [Thermoanaerobaculia bacterium]
MKAAVERPAAMEIEACDALAQLIAAPPAEPPGYTPESWELLRRAAQVHGVAPLLGARMTRLGAWGDHPFALWAADQLAANRLRIARMQAELAEVLAAFDAAGVPVMPLKGAVLAALVYPDPGERPMADLDLLLHVGDLLRGEEILAGLAYDKVFTGWKHVKFSRPGNREIVDPDREHPDNPRVLEVHPRCQERLREETVDLTDRLWAAARPGEILGTRAWLPSAETLWLHLLIHATHHVLMNRFRLTQLVDLVRLRPFLSGPADLLAAIQAIEGTAGLGARAVYAPLALAQRYFPHGPTEELLAGLRVQLSPAIAAWGDGLDLFHCCYLDPAPWRDA